MEGAAFEENGIRSPCGEVLMKVPPHLQASPSPEEESRMSQNTPYSPGSQCLMDWGFIVVTQRSV
jgi:hypothetical protein